MSKKTYTLSVFTENKVGLLNRITAMFTRQHINIDSIAASESEIDGIHRYTIVVTESEHAVEKLVKQIEKQVDVLKAFFHEEEETVYQEIALYKLPASITQELGFFEGLIRKHNIRIISIEKDFLVLEKTGHRKETQELLELLQPLGLLEFVRSGRVAITKPMATLESYLI
jgi:acetolactate synthase-1/3 small subunit